jgi:two-component system OmpR family response regulator
VSATPAAARREPIRVLVVDDEAAIRLLCRVNLEASGMEVVEAEDGQTGLAAAREHRPDLVLLDVMMPALNGWDVARELAETGSSPPVVFLTALADSSARIKAYEHGGVGYILKPFDPVQLASVIEKTIARLGRGEEEALRRAILDDGGELRVEP